MNLAKTLPEGGQDGLERIARRVGLDSAATLRDDFEKVHGATPSAYRARLRGAAPSERAIGTASGVGSTPARSS